MCFWEFLYIQSNSEFCFSLVLRFSSCVGWDINYCSNIFYSSHPYLGGRVQFLVLFMLVVALCLVLALGWAECSSLSRDFVLSHAACCGQWMLVNVIQIGLEMSLHSRACPLALLPSPWVMLLNLPFTVPSPLYCPLQASPPHFGCCF